LIGQSILKASDTFFDGSEPVTVVTDCGLQIRYIKKRTGKTAGQLNTILVRLDRKPEGKPRYEPDVTADDRTPKAGAHFFNQGAIK